MSAVKIYINYSFSEEVGHDIAARDLIIDYFMIIDSAFLQP